MSKIYKLYFTHDKNIKITNKLDYLFAIESDFNKEIFDKCSSVCKTFIISSKSMMFEILKKEKNIKKNSLIGIVGISSSLLDEYAEIIKFYFEYEEIVKRISKKMDKYNRTLIKNSDNYIVKDAIDKFIFHNGGGKYVRAFLIILGYMYKNHKNNLLDTYADDLAIAYETFQTSILVHDDIIDNAQVRRGKPTIPKLYENDFSLNKITDNDNTSNSLAICLADLGFYEANELIVSKYGKDKNFSKLISYYNNVVLKTIKGEIIDVYLPFKGKYMDYFASYNDVIEISKLKTSWYTVVGPFCLGLILSSVDNKKVKQFEEALLPLGIAFQIKDDIMGVFASSVNLGKDCNDISEFKQTLLYHYAVNSDYKDELLKYYGKEKVDSSVVQKVRDIFIKSNAYDKSVDLMNSLFKESKEKINNIKMDKEFRDILFGFISYLEIREK